MTQAITRSLGPAAPSPVANQASAIIPARSVPLTSAQSAPPPATIADAMSQIIATAQTQVTYEKSMASYVIALSKLRPAWSATPLAPYPPAGDTSYPPFPQVNPTLVLTQSSVNAQQRAEPGRVVQGILDQRRARMPKPNAYFAIGACCLVAYLVVRK